jgi:hypothetical protein
MPERFFLWQVEFSSRHKTANTQESYTAGKKFRNFKPPSPSLFVIFYWKPFYAGVGPRNNQKQPTTMAEAAQQVMRPR